MLYTRFVDSHIDFPQVNPIDSSNLVAVVALTYTDFYVSSFKESSNLSYDSRINTVKWSGKRKYPFVLHKLALQPGDCVLFKGSLVHAGAANQEGCIRLHTYFSKKGLLDYPTAGRFVDYWDAELKESLLVNL